MSSLRCVTLEPVGKRGVVTLACVLLSAEVMASATTTAPIPGCGETAAYTFLRLCHIETTLSEVSDQFRQEPGFDPSRASIAQLRTVISDMGAETKAVRFPNPLTADLPVPAILYFRPGRWGRAPAQSTGHFVTLVRRTDQGAYVLDWSPARFAAGTEMPWAEVVKNWDGEAIMPHDRLFGGNVAAIASLAGLCSVVILFVALVRRRRHKVFAVAVMLLGCLGCGSDSPVAPETDSPPLVFDQPVLNLGLTPPTRTELTFPFVVADSPVVIEGIEGSCGCTVADQELLGRELESSSKHVLKVTLHASGDASRTEIVTLKVKTSPPSATPLVLALRYRVRTPPVVSSRLLRVDVKPGERPAASFRVTFHRAPDDAQVLLSRSASTWGSFRVDAIDTTTEIAPSTLPGDRSRLAIDTTNVQMVMPTPREIGEHRDRLTLAFSDGSQQPLDVIVNVRHPYRVIIKQPFVGSLDPGENWTLTIPVRVSHNEVRVTSVSCDMSGVHADATGERLTISGIAPEKSGRFAGNLTLKFSPQEIPSMEIPFSGIVE